MIQELKGDSKRHDKTLVGWGPQKQNAGTWITRSSAGVDAKVALRNRGTVLLGGGKHTDRASNRKDRRENRWYSIEISAMDE